MNDITAILNKIEWLGHASFKIETPCGNIIYIDPWKLNKRAPKADGRADFIIETEGVRIYHAGDTDLIPEMNDIKADIPLLPASGTYVMNSEEAAEAARLIKPRIAIPMHYGDPDVAGTLKDAQDFSKFLKDSSIDVHILSSK